MANAIYDGTSAIMLSGETAAGDYPVEALKTMSAIAERTENEEHYRPQRHAEIQISVSDATAHAACLTAKDVNAAAIVTVSESGNTARLLSKYRPKQPIIACVMDEQVQRQLSLSWGITSLLMGPAHSTDELIEMSTALAEKNGYLHNGELAVVTAGVPVGVSGTTNMIKIHMVGNCLATGVGVGRSKTDLVSASGKACVCRTLEEVKAKFRPGMVLVVPSTTNEMLGYVRDAAALVVEEPGLNSHAAIVGNSLLKPTIVGAAGACSHIRDGLDIAVDCAHGSVPAPAGLTLKENIMERIASFCVDHTKLDRGMYLSRQDGDVLTWDIRMKKPNQGDYLTTGAAHTLEHLFATYARNSAVKDGVIYVGPMGCRTGFYLLTRGLTPAEALELTVESFRFMAGFEGAVPGASEVECGNYRDMDLPAAKAEAAAMLPVLEALTADQLHY